MTPVFCALAIAALASTASAQCEVTGSPPTVTEEREFPPFNGLVVSGGLVVNVSRGEENTSVSISGFKNLMDRINSYVLPSGTLVLFLKPGTCNLNLQVRVQVPSPLLYITASSGVNVTADAVAGSLSASSSSIVKAGRLSAEGPVSLTAASGAAVIVEEGSVGFAAISSSSASAIKLGKLRARKAVVSAAAQSSVTGMEAESATVVASSASSVNITVNSQVSYTCSSQSEITISGRAEVTEWWKGDCQVTINPSAAPSAVILP